MASVCGIFLGAALGHPAEPIAQVVQLGVDRLLGGPLLISIAPLLDQLTPDLGGTDPCEQAVGLEPGIGLAVAIGDVPDVVKQLRQAFLSPLAATAGGGIDAGHPAVQLMGALADRLPAPAEVLLGPPLPTLTDRPDGPGQELPSPGACEFLGGVDEDGDYLGRGRDHLRISWASWCRDSRVWKTLGLSSP
jgi:hypothetical protein